MCDTIDSRLANDGPENSNRPITIWFIDAPTDTQFDHQQQIPHKDDKTKATASLTNIGNNDSDIIPVRIIAV